MKYQMNAQFACHPFEIVELSEVRQKYAGLWNVACSVFKMVPYQMNVRTVVRQMRTIKISGQWQEVRNAQTAVETGENAVNESEA